MCGNAIDLTVVIWAPGKSVPECVAVIAGPLPPPRPPPPRPPPLPPRDCWGLMRGGMDGVFRDLGEAREEGVRWALCRRRRSVYEDQLAD